MIGILESGNTEKHENWNFRRYHVKFENSQGESIDSMFEDNEISSIVEERNSKIDEILK